VSIRSLLYAWNENPYRNVYRIAWRRSYYRPDKHAILRFFGIHGRHSQARVGDRAGHDRFRHGAAVFIGNRDKLFQGDTPLLSALHNGTGKEHKKHNSERKMHKKEERRTSFCAFCGSYVLLVFRSRSVVQSPSSQRLSEEGWLRQ